MLERERNNSVPQAQNDELPPYDSANVLNLKLCLQPHPSSSAEPALPGKQRDNMSVSGLSKEDVLKEIRALEPIECGEDAARHFAFSESYVNLNHGSYGVAPIEVRSVYRHYQDRIEARPDVFTRYEYRTHLLDESRAVVARFLGVDTETCVYVPNSSTAFETIARNLTYEPGDVVIVFEPAYESFLNTLTYLTETTPLEVEKIAYTLPVGDDFICDTFEATVKNLLADGKRPRMALFDTINSIPGTRMPFERLTKLCRSLNVLSCIDGAHGIGQLPLDLAKLNPDFFMSNCHKWLHVPRACAVLYVPARNQHLMRATLPTGFAFTPTSKSETDAASSVGGINSFTKNCASVGTLDDTPYLCVEAALEWRKKLRWSEKNLEGEESIMAYTRDLARKGGQTAAAILGTEVLNNEEDTISNCALVNIRLPISPDLADDQAKRDQIAQWTQRTMMVDYQTAIIVFWYGSAWWARLSSQVYLTMKDFEHAGKVMKEVSEKVVSGGWERA